MGSLLERGPALAVLRELLAQAETRSGRVVLVSGEPGVGKSSLLRGFAAGLPPRLRVLRGACDDLLPAGLYTLLCFVSDDESGIPHAFDGMHKVVAFHADQQRAARPVTSAGRLGS